MDPRTYPDYKHQKLNPVEDLDKIRAGDSITLENGFKIYIKQAITYHEDSNALDVNQIALYLEAHNGCIVYDIRNGQIHRNFGCPFDIKFWRKKINPELINICCDYVTYDDLPTKIKIVIDEKGERYALPTNSTTIYKMFCHNKLNRELIAELLSIPENGAN